MLLFFICYGKILTAGIFCTAGLFAAAAAATFSFINLNKAFYGKTNRCCNDKANNNKIHALSFPPVVFR